MTQKNYKEVIQLIEDIDMLSFTSALDMGSKFKDYLNQIEEKKKQIRRILKNESRETNKTCSYSK